MTGEICCTSYLINTHRPRFGRFFVAIRRVAVIGRVGLSLSMGGCWLLDQETFSSSATPCFPCVQITQVCVMGWEVERMIYFRPMSHANGK